MCRGSLGACDAAEYCDGSSSTCPADARRAAGFECRAAQPGGCDVAEQCDGASAECPADVVAVAGTQCRASASACDAAEQCDGASALCPPDELVPSGDACQRAPPAGCSSGLLSGTCAESGTCIAAIPQGCT